VSRLVGGERGIVTPVWYAGEGRRKSYVFRLVAIGCADA